MSYTHGLDQRTGDLIKNKFTYKVENFIPPGQLKLINSYTRGEEGSYYKDFLDKLEKVVGEMPIAREESHTTDTGEHKAYLKYFDTPSNQRWYVFNRDCTDEQIQAFGSHPDDMGAGRWLDYMNLTGLFRAYPFMQIDMHFKPGDEIKS